MNNQSNKEEELKKIVDDLDLCDCEHTPTGEVQTERIIRALESYARSREIALAREAMQALTKRRWVHPVPDSAGNDIKQCHYQHEAIYDEVIGVIKALLQARGVEITN